MIYESLSISQRMVPAPANQEFFAAALEIDPRLLPQLRKYFSQLGEYLQNGTVPRYSNGTLYFDGRDMDPSLKTELMGTGVMKELVSFFIPLRSDRILHFHEIPVIYGIKGIRRL